MSDGLGDAIKQLAEKDEEIRVLKNERDDACRRIGYLDKLLDDRELKINNLYDTITDKDNRIVELEKLLSDQKEYWKGYRVGALETVTQLGQDVARLIKKDLKAV